MNEHIQANTNIPPDPRPETRHARRPLPRSRLETSARELEASGLYRILRRLEPRPVRPGNGHTSAEPPRIAIVLDTETTGLDPASDEIVELAMIAVTFDDDGFHDVVDVFEGLREPNRPMSAEVEAITRLSSDDLVGMRIDVAKVETFAAQAELVIAHNARFDRELCRRLFPRLAARRWACSVEDVDWRSYGTESSRLSSVLACVGLFHEAHRARSDCEALVEIFAADRWVEDRRKPLRELLRSVQTDKVEIAAVGPTYDWRDQLKSRGYRWSPGLNGKVKGWTISLHRSDAERELVWLNSTVYARDGAPVVTDLRRPT